ncbi:uncharacterized protein LOC121731248 isoform X4 [Aricia agestis]|uniref:uncharacterized protein LOC121731248 isoform X4 n=1 Tax=Aricia agestis TaxID=91739 RepID=UPI001C205C21|nr:uncharacterized protein LOC121731248 isoform X4 [Aricia agestis]
MAKLFFYAVILACFSALIGARPSSNEFYEPVAVRWQPRNQNHPDIYNFDGRKFVPNLQGQPKFTFHLKPSAYASNGEGIAISNPISTVILRPGDVAKIVHDPEATAVAGPGGIAHADAVTQYLPFYGGGKGNYLEIKKDTVGTVLSEKIVPEDKINSDNIMKNSGENLLLKVLVANLQNLRTASSSTLNLVNAGRKKGYLGSNEKTRFRNHLVNLGDVASNTIKLIDELGENPDALFKKNSTRLRQQYPEEFEDDVGEEGVSIESPTDSDSDPNYSIGETIAEAKPYGLAVIAHHGLAASRPVGTAVALSGVALARPVGTAIAGIDPGMLGIDFQSQAKRSVH